MGHRSLLLWSLAACSPVAPTTDVPLPTASDPRTRVLLVHSYHPQYEWTAGITRGAKQVAVGAKDVHLEVYYMDTKRRTSEKWKQEAGEVALKILEEWRPRVVVTADDNAQQYLARHLIGRRDIDIVFCGVNAAPEKYGFPAQNVTGLLERPHLGKTLDILDTVVPNIRKVAMLSDKSPTSDGGFAFLRTRPAAQRVMAWVQPGSFTEWKRQVRKLSSKADALGVFMYHTLTDRGRSVAPREVMAWTVRHTRKPVFALFSFGVDDGALTGYVHSALENGREAMRRAVAVIRGTAPHELEVTANINGQSMINLTSAARLGINVSELTLESFDLAVGSNSGDI